MKFEFWFFERKKFQFFIEIAYFWKQLFENFHEPKKIRSVHFRTYFELAKSKKKRKKKWN
jgi:hypothetical protein